MHGHVLLVEDDSLVALTHRHLLKAAGFTVTHAATGEQAVKLATAPQADFHIILMDIDLGPGIDGTVAAEHILSHNDVPVVFLSSHTEPEVVEKTEKITSYGYVVKASSPTVLFASMKMAFKLHAAQCSLRQAEQQISQERDSLRTIMDASPVGIMAVDRDLRVVDANQAAENIAAKPLDRQSEPRCGDFLGCTNRHLQPLQCGHTEMCANCTLYADIRSTLSSGQGVQQRDARFVLESTEGSRTAYLRYSTSASVIEGRQVALVNFEDISSAKLEQDRMALLSTIADSSANIVIITDAERRTQWVNRSCLALTGYSEEEFLGMNPGELLQGPDPDLELKTKITAALDAGLPYDCEILNYRKDGSHYWIRMHIQPVYDELGVLRNFVAIEHDVTERREIEQELRASDRHVRAIMQQSGDGIARFNGDGIMTHVNPAYCRLVSSTPEELLGMGPQDIAGFVHPEQREALFAAIYDAISRCARGAVYRFACRDRNGKYYWREDNAVYFYTNDCKVDVSYIFARNISDLKPAGMSFELIDSAVP